MPRICIAGPLLGSVTGWVTSQGDVLGSKLIGEGIPVLLTSHQVGRLRRLVDTMSSLMRWRRKYDVLIVLVFSGLSFGIAAVSTIIGKFLGKRVVLWLHGGALPGFSTGRKKLVMRVLQKGDAIVAPSPYLADHFSRLGFEVRVISNILDVSAYPYRDRMSVTPNLLWMRTFHPIYRPEMAVEVVSELAGHGVNVRLTMAGQDRGLQGSMIELAREKEVEDRITFPGFLREPEKMQALRSHDVYISTPTIDNTGVSTLEAAASGLPIVATNVGGVPKMLRDQESALLVADGDVGAMANAVRRLIDEPLLGSRLAIKAREIALRSDWSQVRAAWLQLFDDMRTS